MPQQALWTAFFLLQTWLCWGSAPLHPNLSAISVPSESIVGHGVDVTTGTYVEATPDLVVNCHEPITLYRTHVSCKRHGSQAAPHHLPNEVLWIHVKRGSKDIQARLEEMAGGVLTFQSTHPFRLERVAKWGTQWLAYTGSQRNDRGGLISGRTYLKNCTLAFDSASGSLTLSMGSGEKRIYACRHLHQSHYTRKGVPAKTRDYPFYLTEVIKPSGNRHQYEGDESHITAIQSTSADGKTIFGWVRAQAPYEYISSDGQVLRYTGDALGHIVSVVRNGEKVEASEHFYENSYHRGTCRTFPGGRQLITYYYARDWDFKGDRDGRMGCVHKQLYTGDPRSSEQEVVNITYTSKLDEKKKKREITDITHCLERGHLSLYHYSADRLLTRIERFCRDEGGRQRLQAVEVLDRSAAGHLNGYAVLSPDGSTLAKRTFSCDRAGNLIHHTLWGNLTGLPLQGAVQQKHTTTFSYSHDGFNLCLSESDGRCTIRYSYKPGTDLLTGRFVYDGDQLKERTFYEYDSNASLIRTTSDNGTSSQPHELDGVTYRQIEVITPYAEGHALALPHIIEQRGWDRATGQEILLQRKVLHHDARNRVIQTDIYDAESALCAVLYADYDNFDRCIREVDAQGEETRYRYDAAGNCIGVEKSDGTSTQCSYDLFDQLIKKTISDGRESLTCHYQYDQHGACSAAIHESGHKTGYQHNQAGQIISVRLPGATQGSQASTIHYQYDGLNRLIQQTGADGQIFRYRYNCRGEPVEIVHPHGNRESFVYDLRGALVCHTTVQGARVEYERDYRGRALAMRVFSQGALVRQEFALYSGDLLLSRTLPDGSKVENQYDGSGRLIERTQGISKTTYTYDASSRLATQREWLSSDESLVTTFTYDLLDRLIGSEQSSEDGRLFSRQQWSYDRRGHRTKQLCLESSMQGGSTVYDCLGLPKEHIDPHGHAISLHYQGLKQILTDPLGRHYEIETDPMGRPLQASLTDPEGHTIQQAKNSYDHLGRCLRHTFSAGGDHLQYDWTYDEQGRPTSFTQGADTPAARTTHYHYTPFGEVSYIDHPSGQTEGFAYDELGRVSHHWGDQFDDHYEYDACGRLTQVTSLGGQTRRSYDSEGHLLREELENGLSLAFKVDALGRRTHVMLPDGSAVEYTYDGPFLKSVRRLEASGRLLYHHDYVERDLMGRPLQIRPIVGDEPLTLSWDSLGQLNNIASSWYQADSQRSSLGSLLSLRVQDPRGEQVTSFAYDCQHQLIAEDSQPYHYDGLGNLLDGERCTVDGLSQLRTSSEGEFDYDLDGRVTSIRRGEHELALSYDGRGRLVALTGSQLALQFTYDALNRRLSKTIYLYRDGAWHLYSRLYFLWIDGLEIGAVEDQGRICELRVLGEGWGGERGATVALELDGQTYQPVHDFHGNIAGLVNEEGEVVEWYSYSAFGVTKERSRVGNPWRYAGKRWDEETGLVYFGERYYLPKVGRWLTPDPAGFADSHNPYLYVHNDPTSYSDLMGLWAVSKSQGAKGYQEPRFPYVPPLPSDWKLPTPTTPPRNLDNPPWDRKKHNPYSNTYESPYPRAPTAIPRRSPSSQTQPSRVGYTNGVNTDQTRQAKVVKYLNNLVHEANIQSIHNPTHGVSLDLAEAFVALVTWCETPATKHLQKVWHAFFATAPPEQTFIQICHSAGAIYTRNALRYTESSIRERILVLAVAPGAFIRPGLCGRAIHLVVQDPASGVADWLIASAKAMLMPGQSHPKLGFDLVPYFDAAGAQACRESIIVIKSHPDAEWYDHSIDSPTYERAIREQFVNLCSRRGGGE